MKKNVYLIIIVAILLFGFLFYWYELRPNKIRKECISIAKIQDGFNLAESLKNNSKNIEYNEEKYIKCLLEHGINR